MSQVKIDELLAQVEALKGEKDIVLKVMSDSAQTLADAQVALKAAQDALAANGNSNSDIDTQIQTAIDGVKGVITDLKAKANPDAPSDAAPAQETGSGN